MKLLDSLHHLLVPRHSNNHKAKILHPSSLAIAVAVFLVYQFAINFTLVVKPAVLGFATDISPEKVIEYTNAERLKAGLAPLTANGTLSQAAQLKAGDMFAFDYWAHNSPSGRTPWDFFKEAGYSYLYAGENLARDFMSSAAVVQAWMDSPTHRDNIMNPSYNEIGLAVVNGTLGGVETTLVVQMFGTPVSAAPVPVAQKPPTVEIAPAQPVAQLPIEPVVETEPLPEIQPPEILVEEPVGEPLKMPATTVLARAGGQTTTPPLLSPFFLTKTVALFLLGLVIGALVLDIVLVYRHQVVRLSGRNVAHLLFVATLLLAVILTGPGAIM